METKAPVAADKANGPDAVAAVARDVIVASGRVAQDVETAGKTDFRVF